MTNKVLAAISAAAIKNPSDDQIAKLITKSTCSAARRIVDCETGDIWIWPAELGTHRDGADALGLNYDLPPGAGDILVL